MTINYNIISPILVFVLLAAILVLESCGEDLYYEQTYNIEAKAWRYEQELDFEFEMQDTTNRYDLLLDIAHLDSYPFQNIYIKIKTLFPSGKILEEVVPIDMANKKGEWYGNCKGANCNLTINLQQSAYFNELGNYHLNLSQYMRKSPLKGIEMVGFKLKTVDN